MVSVIILTWNSQRYIKNCLESVIKDCKKSNIDFEIFVVDNGSTDNTIKIVRSFQEQNPKINLISYSQNLGTTETRNVAIKKSKGNYILILDSDTEVKKGSISKLLKTLKGGPKIGIACPQLLYNDGTPQKSFKKFPTLWIKILKFLPFGFSKNEGEELESYNFEIDENKIYPVDYCISACWLFRKELVDKIGYLDENIFYSPEDVDYCLRCWLDGYKVVYAPKAKVIHYTQRISYKSKKITLSHIRGLFYYFRKYGYLFSRKGIYQKITKSLGRRYPILKI